MGTSRPEHARPSTDLASLFAGSPRPTLLVDAFGQILFANRGPRGEPGASLIGRELGDVFRGEHAELVRACAARAAQERTATSRELGDTGPAGARLWWRLDASPVPEDCALLQLTDLTERRREEERLRRAESLMVDAQGIAHLGTWEWDVTQPNATWSAELYRIYGLTPETYTPSYEGYLKLVHPDDRERVMRVTEAVFKEHKPYSHDERIFRPTGEMRWLHTWAVPVLDDDGKLARLVGVCQDVTDAKRAEGAMRAQLMTRSLARRLLHDLIQRANVPDHVIRELGRALAREHGSPQSAPGSFAAAFEDMGFGKLRFEGKQGDRYTFVATDLLERRAQAALPSCYLTLGYLEGAVGALVGKAALGTEMRCQSAGHDECRFVVQ